MKLTALYVLTQTVPALKLSDILKNVPSDIVGIGSENGYVWVALDDARSNIEPRAIKRLLEEVLALLTQ